MGWSWRDVSTVAREVRTRPGGARAGIDATLARLKRDNDGLSAFVFIDGHGARVRADRIDDSIAGRDDPGTLAAVPIGIKDNLVTKGVPTTCASRVLESFVPSYDATAVERLIAAGAVPVGKLNMDEFAMGSSGEHSAFGAARNPWDPERVAGGSSGGAATAVAAGLVPAALGSDTGGSIRQPAAFCGVVGLKPTYGRVSRHGLIAFASSLDCVGPLGRTVADCATLLEVLAGVDPRDSTSLDQPVPAYRSSLAAGTRGLRIGVPDGAVGAGVEAGVARAFAAALEQLRELGATVVDIELPHGELELAAYYVIACAEASSNLARYDGLHLGARRHRDRVANTRCATRGLGFGPEVKRRILIGSYALSAGNRAQYYLKAQRVRARLSAAFERVLSDQVDLVATPTCPTTAFARGERVDDPLTMYRADSFTLPASLAGLPAISVPCGFSDGLPVGLQLVGRRLDEPTVIAAAAAYEAATRWHDRWPPGFAPEERC